jgi:hypothetical protein
VYRDPVAAPPPNAILDAAQAMITRFLTQSGFRLAEPVGAAFHLCTHGSTGVAVTVKLSEPRRAPAARAVIAERFGAPGGVDVFDVR